MSNPGEPRSWRKSGREKRKGKHEAQAPAVVVLPVRGSQAGMGIANL